MTAVEDPAVTTASHPLEPLTGDEIAAASTLLRKGKDLGTSARFVFVTLQRADQGRAAGLVARQRPAAEGGAPRRVRAGRAHHVRGGGLAHRPVGGVLGTDPGRAAADHGGGVHRLRGDRAGRPALAGGHAQARRHGLLAHDGRPVGVELHRPGRRRRQAPHRAAADVRALGAGRERLRPAGGGPDLRGRPRRACEVVEVEDHGVVPLPPAPGNYDRSRGSSSPGTCRRSTRFREDLKPIEITQPEGPSFTVDGHDVALAEVAACGSASPRARAWSCTRSSYDGPADRPPRLARRDVRARTATPRPRTASRTCSTRASTASGWLANSLDAGLRLRRATSTTSTASSTTTTASPS